MTISIASEYLKMQSADKPETPYARSLRLILTRASFSSSVAWTTTFSFSSGNVTAEAVRKGKQKQ